MPFDSLGAYWPETFIPPGRRWIVENVSDGVISRFDAVLDIEPGDFENDRFSCGLGRRLARVREREHQLSAPDAAGDGGQRYGAVQRGIPRPHDERRSHRRNHWRRAEPPSLSEYPFFRPPHGRWMIEAGGTGGRRPCPAGPSAARAGEQDRAASRQRSGGTVHTLFALELPLLQSIEAGADRRQRRRTASGCRGSSEDCGHVVDMTEGSLRLGVDNASLDLRGTAKLQGMPAAITWRENFGDDAPFARRLRRVDDADAASPVRAGVRYGALRSGHSCARRGIHRSGGRRDATHDAPRRCDGGAARDFGAALGQARSCAWDDTGSCQRSSGRACRVHQGRGRDGDTLRPRPGRIRS